jgi:hypothetical protein
LAKPGGKIDDLFDSGELLSGLLRNDPVAVSRYRLVSPPLLESISPGAAGRATSENFPDDCIP